MHKNIFEKNRIKTKKSVDKAVTMVYYNKALGTQGLRVAAKRRGIAQLVEQRSPKPRAEGSSPSAPATKPAKTLGFCRFSFCMCCMVMWFALVQTPGFLIWFDPFSTVPIPSSTQNAPGFAFSGPNRVHFPVFVLF